MSKRRLIFIVIAVLMAGATVQLTRNRGAVPGQAPAPEAKAVRILVAAADLPAGLLLQPDHLKWRAWPDGSTDGYVVEGSRTLEEFPGAVVRQGIRAGEPIVDARIVKPGDRRFLAAVLNPDMRA